MQARIVLIKSILTICVFVFAIVLPSLGLTAWFATKLRDPVRERLFTVHRWIGRTYVLIIFGVGVIYCLITLGPQGYDQRVFAHSGLGLALLALLSVKILTVRGKIPPLSDHIPKLGSMLAVLTAGIFLTSAFWFFRVQATSAAPVTYGSAAVSGTTAEAAAAGGDTQAFRDAGKALFEQRCSQCHAAARATSATRTRDDWSATIQRMVTQNGASITPAEQSAILEYLATSFGK
jgi:cytochrome c5